MKEQVCTVLLHINCMILLVYSLHLIGTPRHIDPGTSKLLIINCSFNVKHTPEWAFLNSLVISRSVTSNSTTTQIVASINSMIGRVNVYDGDGAGSGFISNKDESFLCVQWAFPMPDLAGEYICEANGMRNSWRPETISISSKIYSDPLSFNSLFKQLRASQLEISKQKLEIDSLVNNLRANKLSEEIVLQNLHQEVKTLNEEIAQSSDFINKSKEQMQDSLKTLFFESPVYDGRRYYLTRQSVLVLSTLAQATCSKYGGYLAEIDDDGKFHFVRKFLKEHPYFYLVMFAGTDEGHEGYWTYSRNNTALKYIKWNPGQPNGGNRSNCLTFWRGVDWYVSDEPCAVYSIDQSYGYLCEIMVN